MGGGEEGRMGGWEEGRMGGGRGGGEEGVLNRKQSCTWRSWLVARV